MKKSNKASPTILHTLFPAFIDLVSLWEELRTLLSIESKELEIWFITELSAWDSSAIS